MHMASGPPVQHPALLPSCLFFTLLPLYYFSWQYNTFQHAKHNTPASNHSPVWSQAWIDEWLSTQVVQPFDPYPLKTYCNKTVWKENLVFNLENANGGIGNIRGNTLDFILYAIEAGASIILPGRASRSANELSDVWAGRASFDTFFDEDWFLDAMLQACPQMSIYKPLPGQSMVDPLSEKFWPQSRRTDTQDGVSRPSYTQAVEMFLGKQAGYKADQVSLVNLERTLWYFDTRSFPLGLRRTVGQLLRITPKIRRLAAVVVQQLAMTHFLVIDPTAPVPSGAFLGAHLRTEADAAKAGWLDQPNTNFSAQTDAYIKQALASGLKTMYVASGDAEHLRHFKEKAALYKLNVTSKLDLLTEPEDVLEFNALTWDQQALIDYEILQRCSVFGGFVRSSFSFNIAMTRGQWLEDQRRVVDPWIVLHSEAGVAFDDGISRIVGRDAVHEARIPRGMWP